MFTITPGKYNAYGKDGNRITWGGESLRFVVTMDNELKLYTGEHAQPQYVGPIIRKGFRSRDEFQEELTTLAYATILHHTMGIVNKLAAAADLLEVIRDGKRTAGIHYFAHRISADEWERQIRQYGDQENITLELARACIAEIKRMDPTAEIITEIEGL